jgi:hypothetical protein
MPNYNRPERRDNPTARTPIPNLCFTTLRRRLEAAKAGKSTRADNQEFYEHSYVTLYRASGPTRWDLTATVYDGSVTLYLNHTRIAYLTDSAVSLWVDPYQRTYQTLTWLNRVLKDNHTGHVLVTRAGNWFVWDRTYDPTKDDMTPYTFGTKFPTPDSKDVLTNV